MNLNLRLLHSVVKESRQSKEFKTHMKEVNAIELVGFSHSREF